MIQRLKEFGGDLHLRNAGPGTVVELTVPIEQAAPNHPRLKTRPLDMVTKESDASALAEPAQVPQKLS
jgi:hypothetical protein